MAIAANELRIGNLVMWQDEEGIAPLRITGIMDGDDVWVEMTFQDGSKDGTDCGYDSLKPIPLTSDILIACGFKKHDNSNEFWNFWELKNGWHIGESLHNEPGAGVEKGYCYWGDNYLIIHSLHQLQNLYFALTSKELEYKP